jgi:hypothetical protein
VEVPNVRRRWVVLAAVVILVLGALRLLYQPVTLESYRTLDPQTVVVVGYGAPGAWTRVSNVSETESTVTISVDAFTFEPFPHTDVAARLEVQVRLSEPLGARTVIDGATGQELPEAGG